MKFKPTELGRWLKVLGKTGCFKEQICFVQSNSHNEHYPEPIQTESDFSLLRSLDDTYNENMLDLLVQIPTVVFAYWEISSHQQQAIGSSNKLYLRLYKLINEKLIRNSQMVKETPVAPVGSYYFTELEAGISYYCELGWYSINNIFYSCLQSRIVTTPWIDKYPYAKPQAAGGIEHDLMNKLSLYNKDAINSLMIYMGITLK